MTLEPKPNLVRKGLIPDSCLAEAQERIFLRTANGQRLDGGDKIVNLKLGFRQVYRNVMQEELRWLDTQFYEADIMIDAILSYPWLEDTKLAVFLHLKALASMDPEFSLLFGLRGDNARKKAKNRVRFCEPIQRDTPGQKKNSWR